MQQTVLIIADMLSFYFDSVMTKSPMGMFALLEGIHDNISPHAKSIKYTIIKKSTIIYSNVSQAFLTKLIR